MVVISGNFVEAAALNDEYFARGFSKLTRMCVRTTAFLFPLCGVVWRDESPYFGLWTGKLCVAVPQHIPTSTAFPVVTSERRSCSINRLRLRGWSPHLAHACAYNAPPRPSPPARHLLISAAPAVCRPSPPYPILNPVPVLRCLLPPLLRVDHLHPSTGPPVHWYSANGNGMASRGDTPITRVAQGYETSTFKG